MRCADFVVQSYPKSRADKCSLRDLAYKAQGTTRRKITWWKPSRDEPRLPRLPAQICVPEDQDTISKMRKLGGCIKIVSSDSATCLSC